MQELTPLDRDALDLIQQARKAWDDQIRAAVELVRVRNEREAIPSTLAALLAGESTKLHERLNYLNKRRHIQRLLGRQSIKLTKGPNFHLPYNSRRYIH